MKKLRSVLSIVLVIAMVLSLLPHSVPRTHAEGQRMEVTIQKYGYETVGGEKKMTVPHLPGAYLQVQDSKGNKVYPTDAEFFISGESAKVIELPPGQYQLVELSAPDGYIGTSQPVPFTVKEATTILDTQATYESQWIPPNNQTEIRGVGGNVIYYNGKYHPASCIQADKEDPDYNGTPSRYVPEGDYTAFGPELKEQIKRVIYKYQFDNAEAYRILGRSNYPKANLYWAVARVIEDLTLQPGKKKVHDYNISNNNSEGKLLDVYKYFMDVAMDATIVTFGWQLIFFTTDEAHQDLVVVELEKKEPVVVKIGNEKASAPAPDSVTLPVELSLSSSKTLNGGTLTAGQFTFHLTDGLGNWLQTATNDAQGKISFNKLSFNQPGNYTYKIKEDKGSDASITYDESIKTFTVSVEKQGSSLVITKVSGDATVTAQGNAAAPVPGQSGIGTAYPGSYSFVNIGDSQAYTLTIDGTVWNAFCLDHFRADAKGSTYRLSSTLDQAYGSAAETIKGILYYGYPMDGSGEIMQAIYNMGYTGEKAKAFFSYATNYAIWKATGTIVDASGDFKSEVVRIGNMILGKGKAPSHVNLAGYVYTSGNLQPLLIYTMAGANGITGIAAGSFVNNYYKPETVEVKGVKTWADDDNQNGSRPMGITVRLYANNVEVASKSVTAAEGWAYSFSNLAKYDENGRAIVYSISEDAVPGYSTVIDGYNVINIKKPEEVTPKFKSGEIPAELTLRLSKSLEGADINSAAYRNAFEFVIEGSYGAPLPGATRVRNEGASVSFGKIWFTKAGTYTYTVKEVAGNESGMSYSTETKTFTVTVEARKLGPNTRFVITNIDTNGQVTPAYSYVGDFPAVNMPTSGTGTSHSNGGGSHGSYFLLQSGGTSYIAFCLDHNRYYPSSSQYYTQANSEWDVQSKEAILKGIGYYGYPYDGSGTMLQYAANQNRYYLGSYESAHLSDERLLQYATNNAVWMTMDPNYQGADPNSGFGRAVMNTAREIIRLAKTVPIPDYVQVTMSVYKPSYNSYQRLVAFEVVTKPHAASLSFTDSFVNVKEEKTEVSGIKTWNDNNNQDGKRPASITINLLANGQKVDSRTVTAANNWRYSFTNLPKKANGRDIEYTITEEAVSGYTTEVNGYNVTNTHKPEKTEVSGKKIWVDGNNQDGTRPESIIINLFADGRKVDSKVVTAADNWSFRFTNLDKYANGKAIAYTITENEVTGYSTEVNGFQVTNTYTPETVEVSGSKTWNDGGNQDGKRPASITVKLLADGDVVQTKIVTAADEWKYSFTNLPKCREGIEIKYTIAEDVVEGYSTQINGYDIINTYTPGKTEISGIKTWNDAENQDGKRPASITIRLYADGVEIDSRTVTAQDNWTYKFSNLDLKKSGKLIQYTVSEDKVEEYTTEIDGYNVTNTHKPETTKVEGSKTWNDGGNQDGKRPGSITINLLADGEVADTKTVTEADGWKYSFTNLPKYKEGKEINYTITEEKVADYTTEINGYDVTNSYTPGITEVSGTKTWNDKDNQDGKRPTAIVVRLYADGKEIDSKTVTAQDQWSYKFENLPKMAGGKAIQYTVSEDEVAGYTTKIDGFDIINSYTPETTKVEGSKTWNDEGNQDGKRPVSITVRLLANGKEIASKTVTVEDGWKYSFTNLDKYWDGNEISYTISEDPVELYESVVNGYDVINTYVPETVEVSGLKTWNDGGNQDGIRPTAITVNLLADGEKVDSVTVTEAEEWKYSFTNLPKCKDGIEIEYTVTEDTVAGYRAEITGFDITNHYTPGKTEISGIKTWKDADNQDGKRPASITIRLYADGVEIDSRTVTAQDNWTYKFSELDLKKGGKLISYTISEDPVAAYTTDIDGYNVTNNHTPETTKVEGSKTWNDGGNQDGKRPGSITINLLADGEVADTKTVTEADGWKYSFTNLPKYKEGKEIKYTITEEKVTDYTTVINGYDVTNSYTPDITEVSGTKTWNDKDNQDNKRPTSIVVRLYADGKEIASQTVTVATNWTYKFENLPKMANGQVIKYTISEDEVPGYTTEIQGTDVINSYTPETTEVEGSKTWVDDGEEDGKRPESITINLLANGQKVASKTVTAKDSWKYSFTGLDKYRDGNEITYTVTEEPVNGYATEIDGYDVINTKQDIKTKASDQADGDKYLENQGSVTVKDVVEYTSLIPGRKYTMEGQLVKKSDGSVITTARTSFTASETGFGKVELLFIFPADALRGEALVAFETCKYGEEEVAVHADINDEDQTVYVPEIGTTATDSVTKDHIAGTGEAVTIHDVVAYKGLIPGKEYTMEGRLHVRSSGEAIGKTVTKTFTANESGSGKVTLSFTLTAEEAVALRGDSVVAFETAKEEGKVVAVHADLKDEEQTVHFPEVKTNATDKADGDKTLEALESVTIVDTVTYTNLIPGKTYTVSGTLMDKATGQACTFPGATASKTFVAEEANGSVELEFTFDASHLQRKVLVVFETLSYNGKVVATHQDLTDVAQTVEVEGPIVDIYVNKVWKGDDESSRPASITVKLLADGKDTGKTLLLSAENKWTGAFKDLEAKKNGKAIAYTVEEVGVAGYISTISGNGGKNVTITNSKPEIKTQASDQKDGDKYLENQGSVTVKDVVDYKGLIPGKEYTMEGQLVKKSDASVVTTATAKFTASESGAGKVELLFTFPADALKGEALVAFESCKYGEDEIAVHADINDEDQTVYVPAIGTTATDSVTEDHIANAESAVTIIDVVAYKGLIPGKEYTMEGQLHVKSSGKAIGRQITRTFVAGEKGSGSVTMEFTLTAGEALALKGDSVVAFETALEGDKAVAVHADIHDEDQTVRFPEAKTNATDKADGDKTLDSLDKVTVVDKVTYTNLIPGKTYTVSGTLMDKATGQACTFEGATASKTFVAKKANGSVDLEFTFDASALQRKVLVVFETVTYNGNVVATHQDLNDQEQTVEVEGPTTEINVVKRWLGDDINSRPAYITVKLIADGVDTGKTLTLSLANNWRGSFKELDAKLKGKDIVYTVEEVEVAGYETSIEGNGTLNVTITNGKAGIETQATDQKDGDKYLESQGSVTVKDVVEYKGLIPGKEYSMEGQLVKKSDTSVVATASKTFTASASGAGKVELLFTFPADSLKGEALVAFETCKYGEDEVAVHADINDEDQTVYVPEIGTTATDSVTQDHIANAGEAVTIIDVVAYKALIPGGSYTMEGQLHVKSNGESFGKKVVQPFTASESGSGSVTIEFVLSAEEAAALKGQSVVAFETVRENGQEVAVHADINDENQTVHFPEAKTNAVDKADGDKILAPEKQVTVVDKVTYTNLIPGKTYTVSGTLMDKASGEACSFEGATASKTFVAETADGSVELEFTFDASNLQRQVLVVFETVTYNGKVVATHQDLTDADQTVEVESPVVDIYVNKIWKGDDITARPAYITVKLIANGVDTGKTLLLSLANNWTGSFTELQAKENGQDVIYTVEEVEVSGYISTVSGNGTRNITITNAKPSIETEATDQADGDKYLETQGTVTVKDVVEYKDLIPGKEYTMEGQLVRKSDGGLVTTASRSFTASESGNGKVELLFTFPVDSLKGEALVAFETCKFGEEEVAVHADINDEDQTVYVPEIGTTATDSQTGGHMANASEAVTIIDVVEYKALIPGATYTMEGQLHLKSDGEKTIGETVTKTFIADESGNGSVAMEFHLTAEEAAALKGESVVAFETVKENGKEIAVHADINDENQTVYFPEAKTNATDKVDGDKTVRPVEMATILDEVTYTNLQVGKEYTISGSLHIKNADGSDGGVLVIDGKEVTATKTFIAYQANGSETLEFTLDASALNGRKVVAFEKVLHEGKVVATHEDIMDVAQTVEVKGINISVKKTWIGEAPNFLRLQLKRDGAAIELVTLSAYTNWSYEWKGLPADHEYEVVEVVPAGYVQTGMNVSKDKDGNYLVELENTGYPEVKINKTDMGGTEVDGAEIMVFGDDLELTWISKIGETMSFVAAPGVYTMIEINAPEGYQQVTTDIEFRVDLDGTVTVLTTLVEPAGAVEVRDGVLILKDEIEEMATIPPVTEEETTKVNAETAVPTTEAEEEEESTTVPEETTATIPPTEEVETTTREDAETVTPAPTTTRPSAPDTGDHSNIMLYVAMLGAATSGTGFLLSRRKKEEE
ncbi:MAG: VaFE repeat-containing surface-anchored protein [Lachnospiraceae bacterium]|nr:VaFE repeat-containing surface-anchored protein [Lachnospiraceae bacterium]